MGQFNPWSIINVVLGIVCGAYFMHLWWLRRWNRVENLAEHFRDARDEGTKRMKSEQDPTRAHTFFAVVVGKHFAYELTKNYALQGVPLSKAIDDIGPPPGTPTEAITPPGPPATVDHNTEAPSTSGS
jgi:hypothetical protein